MSYSQNFPTVISIGLFSPATISGPLPKRGEIKPEMFDADDAHQPSRSEMGDHDILTQVLWED